MLGAALIAFAAWGLFTPAGAGAFDEMDGLIPFFAGLLGVGLVLGGGLVWWLKSFRSKSRGSRSSR
ncbi:MAG: hypothetical protein QM756_20380 [Polyangiaceae bacterium]